MAVIRKNVAFRLFRRPGPGEALVAEKLYAPVVNLDIKVTVLLGHTRQKARGGEPNLLNDHPLRCDTVIGTHNGWVANADRLAKTFRLRRVAEVDSEVLLRLVDRSRDDREFRSLLARCRGRISAAFVRLGEPGRLRLLKGDMPLHAAYVPRLRSVSYASEAWMLRAALDAHRHHQLRVPVRRRCVSSHAVGLLRGPVSRTAAQERQRRQPIYARCPAESTRVPGNARRGAGVALAPDGLLALCSPALALRGTVPGGQGNRHRRSRTLHGRRTNRRWHAREEAARWPLPHQLRLRGLRDRCPRFGRARGRRGCAVLGLDAAAPGALGRGPPPHLAPAAHAPALRPFAGRPALARARGKDRRPLARETLLLERAAENRNEPCEIDIEVADDCELDLCGLPVRVLTTPGHCPASLSFLIPVAGESCLFSGDLIMPGGDLGWMGEFCHDDLVASLRKLLDLPVDYQYAGHGCGAFGLGKEWLAAAVRKAEAGQWPTPLPG